VHDRRPRATSNRSNYRKPCAGRTQKNGIASGKRFGLTVSPVKRSREALRGFENDEEPRQFAET